MKKKIFYSVAAFLIVFAGYFGFGFSEMFFGVVKWSDAPTEIIGSLIVASIASIIIFIILRVIRFGDKPEGASYRPSRNFVVVASVLTAMSLSFGIFQSYSSFSEKRQVAETAKKTEEARQQKMAALAESERQRVAALTPEQREAEAKLKAQQAKAAEEAAVKEAARKAKENADKVHRDFQMKLAGLAAKQLKNGMKDPDSFELKSLLFMPNGTACYEYRATNSFGAHLAGAAVLTTKGKLLVQEQNGNAFVSAWNKECTVSGGEDIADLVKIAILN
jgi:hypothetical protein